MIANSVIEQIHLRADISSVVGDYLTLRRKGNRLSCCCPFHNDKSPSFFVNPHTNTYHCYGCGEHGDAIAFVMKKEGLTFAEAVRKLAHKYNIPIEEETDERTNEEREAAKKREALQVVYQVVQKYFVEALYKDTPEAKQALAYATSRWNKDFCMETGIGYAPNAWQGLIDFAKKHSLSLDLLIEVGLVKISEKTGKPFDFFRERLMIPIRDKFGVIIGYTARDLTGKEDSPKYLNSPTSILYKKEKSVFGIDIAARAAVLQHSFFLVEGAPDVLRLQSITVTNAVASLGSDWTDDQLAILKRYSDTLIFLPDADPPKRNKPFGTGIEKVLKTGRRAWEQGFHVYVREIPLGNEGQKNDPDTYCKSKTLLDELEQKDFVLWYAKKRFSAPAGTFEGNAMEDIAALVACVDKDYELDKYISAFHEEISKGKTIWRKAIEAAKRQRGKESLQQGKNQVSLDLFEKFGFQEHRKTYISIGEGGKTIRWSNFIMHPLFHIRDNQSALRLFEIENEDGEKTIIEFKQEDLVSLTKFKQKVESLGNFVWLVKDEQLTRLKQYLYKTTETAELITQLGWQRKGFFAFGNGVFTGTEWKPVDDFGIVRMGEKGNFYLPAFSSIYKEDVSLYQFERNFVHYNWNTISLRRYCEQLIEVFGDNAKVGIAFLFAALFRDVVTAQTKSFPILNLFGPKGSGKSELGHSLMSFFIIENTPPNIQNSTLPALADTVAQCANALVHIDEFKNTIDIDKREFLKGLWDGAGRNRMNMDKDKKREVTRVDCGVILSGQEMATADIALFSRFIFLRYNKSEFTAEAKEKFNRLRDTRKLGCSHLTLEILKHRDYFAINFREAFDKAYKDIQELMGDTVVEDRILLNWTIPVAAFGSLKDRIEMPFTYEDLCHITAVGIVDQNKELKHNNEVAVFWDIVGYLRQEGQVVINADYRLEYKDKLKVDEGQIQQEYIRPKQILFLRYKRIFELYLLHGKRIGETLLPKTSLAYYLENSPAYLGKKKSQRFKNIIQGQQQYDSSSGFTPLEESVVDQAYCFDYDMLKEQFNINLEVSTDSIYNDPDTDPDNDTSTTQDDPSDEVIEQELPY